MTGMKISISMPEEDVEFLDAYADRHGLESRSAAVKHAVRIIRTEDLRVDYSQAWKEWEGSEDATLWDSAAGDGL